MYCHAEESLRQSRFVDSDNVELRLVSARRAEHSFHNVTDGEFFAAKCNKTAMVDNKYEDYVSAPGLNIAVQPGHVLAVFLNPHCSSPPSRFFQPAVINKASTYDVVFVDSNNYVWSQPNISLYFSATITGIKHNKV